MFIVDQLKKGDRTLQILAWSVLAGLAVLAGGLWYVQVVSGARFQKDHQNQSFRTVRVPALRGRILDRNGIPLADNQAVFNLGIYLDELRPRFEFEYTNNVKKEFLAQNPGTKLTQSVVAQLYRQSRFRAATNLLMQLGAVLRVPCSLNEALFNRHYLNQRSLLLPLVTNLGPQHVALFDEYSYLFPEVELEVQSVRTYPQRTLAAHLLGHLRRDDQPTEDEGFSYRFLLPDYSGAMGLESAYDADLRGHAGVKEVVVNHMAYRQSEEMKVEPEPGSDVMLTIDVPVQQAAEGALRTMLRPEMSGAVVVMDVNSGDILVMASAPTFDPNYFLNPPTNWGEVLQQWREHPVYLNRATSGRYEPGSTFKIVVALAGLESGLLDPKEIYHSAGSYRSGGGRHIDDTAPAGDYDFEKAFYKSSNAYFIDCGVRIGHEKIIEMGRRLGLGQPTGLPTRQEANGYFPPDPSSGKVRKRDASKWMQGDTENLSIGHGEVLVTPLQMAVLTAAVANGGKVLRPRLTTAIRPLDSSTTEDAQTFAAGVVRAELGLSQRTLKLLREAMLADVELPDGTGYRGAHISNYKICGKTGTAKITPELRKTWFVSYAPFESPRYAVAVVVEPGVSGGHTCAPIAKKVYEALIKRDQALQAKSSAPANP